ncbi:hypothetical protein I79_001938 [Cricetulus griseus]|uniref:Uncharacterized protein n=1 Tax=Cricetulus griseus TaxID=10029 RepID=G3GW27_CRIGR|nr:hypothetical protein I79_001938 [Cricetulus griseus]
MPQLILSSLKPLYPQAFVTTFSDLHNLHLSIMLDLSISDLRNYILSPSYILDFPIFT